MQSEQAVPTKSLYSWYVLVILTVVNVFNWIDRSVLSILQEAIKVDLHLSDSQLGALTGLAFGLFYATLAIPIARLADRSVRKNVIACAVGVWSAMTSMCGLAHGFAMLAFFRMGVAVGEAGGVPPTVSLLSDYFRRRNRATAMAVLGLSTPIGIMIGIFAGGWLKEYLGWREAFLWIGAAGLMLAPIVYFTVREPKRGAADGLEAVQPSGTLGEAIRFLWNLRSFRHLTLAASAQSFAIYATLNWTPSFYARVHEMGTGNIGTVLGLMLGIGGLIGTVSGGLLADRLSRRNVGWYMWVPGLAALFIVPAALVQYLSPDLTVSLVFGFVPALLASVYIGPLIAVSQSLAPPHMRATAQSIQLVVFSIAGLGLGPLLMGVISDFLAATDVGTHSLRYALSIAVLFNLWSAFHYWWGGRILHRDLKPDSATA